MAKGAKGAKKKTAKKKTPSKDRTAKGTFVAGHSKPGPGRPKGKLDERCREFMEKEGLDGLLAMVRDGSKADKRYAYDRMLERGWGSPRQYIDQRVEDTTPKVDSLRDKLAFADSFAEKGSDGDGKSLGGNA